MNILDVRIPPWATTTTTSADHHIADMDCRTTSRPKRTSSPAAARRPTVTIQPGFPSYRRPRVQRSTKRKIDAEVGKAHHMRVSRRRQQRSRRFPGPVISTTPQPYPYPWPIPSHVEHGPWLWLGNRWKSWGARALSPMRESCGPDWPLAVSPAENFIGAAKLSC